jgi:hypothetical protein
MFIATGASCVAPRQGCNVTPEYFDLLRQLPRTKIRLDIVFFVAKKAFRADEIVLLEMHDATKEVLFKV